MAHPGETIYRVGAVSLVAAGKICRVRLSASTAAVTGSRGMPSQRTRPRMRTPTAAKPSPRARRKASR
eukprot:436363-Pyramimonas_sp.AAC.1